MRSCLGVLLTAAAIWFLGFGLWQHDWRVILTSVALIIVWPLIGDEVIGDDPDERAHRELLDRLWDDDDDLPRSA